MILQLFACDIVNLCTNLKACAIEFDLLCSSVLYGGPAEVDNGGTTAAGLLTKKFVCDKRSTDLNECPLQ